MRVATAVVYACLCLLAPCTQARSVNPKHLVPVDPEVEYVLSTDVSVQGYNITFTLRAGTYVMRYRDRKGTYLMGDGNCMRWDIHSPKVTGTNDFPCGIYLPDDTRKGASFYVVRAGSGIHPANGPVVNAIIRYNHGSFDWPDKAESHDLRAQLAPVQP